MKLILKLSLCIYLLLGLSIHSYAQLNQSSDKTTTIPSGLIIDEEHIFSKSELISLESQLADFTKTTKIPMRVMVMPNASSSNGQWRIGNTESAKGIQLMISKTSKEISIGVGPELTKSLTKDNVDNIINTTLITAFQSGQYATGISTSIKALLMQLVH